jgi:hypothetical protein
MFLIYVKDPAGISSDSINLLFWGFFTTRQLAQPVPTSALSVCNTHIFMKLAHAVPRRLADFVKLRAPRSSDCTNRFATVQLLRSFNKNQSSF